MKYYAVYTKRSDEYIVAFQLQEKGIKVLNPLPCCLSAHFDRRRYSHIVNDTKGVRYIIGEGNPIVLLDEIVNMQA